MIGVGNSHYARPKEGPFKCSNCEYFKSPTFCGHPTVIADAKRGLIGIQGGKAIVEPEGCCNEFETR